ncbi:Copia type Polyprotein [Phytophthora megakarya]|uniref:Copia type Polyprotein n=1 Tax=Phytophthora megakarya TaxID=4795 RepID=A0A225UBT7_9STRA|nr:Copia type Polyprotein [Phytophthora megakarya]
MYLATTTRPDMAYAVGQFSRFVSKPTTKHCGAVKRCLRFLAATKDHGISFDKMKAEAMTTSITIEGFCDADWANCPDTRKSISGFVLSIGGGPVSWSARRQSVVAQSTAEAEYVASCEACMEGRGLVNVQEAEYVASCEACMEGRGLVNVLTEVLPKEIPVQFNLGIDSQSALALAASPTYSRRTRHIDLRFHFVRDQVMKRQVKLWKVLGNNNPADIFTKPLALERFAVLKTKLGMVPKTASTPREIKRKSFFSGRSKCAESFKETKVPKP